MEVSRVPLLQGIEKEKGYTRYTLLPTGPVTEADVLHQNRGSRCPWEREGWNRATAILRDGTMGHPPESLGDS